MKKTYSFHLILSVCVVILYVTFTVLAFARYPLPYSPVDHWLSDLGNPAVNLTGAGFYNTGIVLTGIVLMFFFLRLAKLRMPDNRLQRSMIMLTMGFGCVGSFAMIMTTVYPINQPSQHSFWSMILYFSFGTAFAFSVAALRYHPGYPRALLGFGVIVAFVNLIVQIFFHDVPVSEWINVPLLLAYCLCLGMVTYRMSTP